MKIRDTLVPGKSRKIRDKRVPDVGGAGRKFDIMLEKERLQAIWSKSWEVV